LKKFGKKKWRKYVHDVVVRLTAALQPEEIVIGGGNAGLLKNLPPGCRLGDNADAFRGGFRIWERARLTPSSDRTPVRSKRAARVNVHART
jgi:polyphosphate glucokinase